MSTIIIDLKSDLKKKDSEIENMNEYIKNLVDEQNKDNQIKYDEVKLS